MRSAIDGRPALLIIMPDDVEKSLIAPIHNALTVAYHPFGNIAAQVELSFLEADDMREVNHDTRGVDAVTDVLSFPSLRLRGPVTPEQLGGKLGRTVLDPETGRIMLGDILICLDKACAQACEYGHAMTREVAFLAVHGLLHLLGHDHETQEEEAAMQALQEAALTAAGLPREVCAHQSLLDQARAVRTHAYAPYSEYQVGACLQASDGTTFTGVNVENASYGVTLCAERSALAAAIAAGARSFTAIAISAKTLPMPCGICRQALAEFSPDMRVMVADDDGQLIEQRLNELLPAAFKLTSLEET